MNGQQAVTQLDIGRIKLKIKINNHQSDELIRMLTFFSDGSNDTASRSNRQPGVLG